MRRGFVRWVHNSLPRPRAASDAMALETAF